MHDCGIKHEDGYTVGLTEAALLSSSCCSTFTLTAGAYVTLGPHHFFPPQSPSLLSPPLTYRSAWMFYSAPPRPFLHPADQQWLKSAFIECWMRAGHELPSSQQLFPSLLESQNALNHKRQCEPTVWVLQVTFFYSLKCSSASPLHRLVSKFQTFGPISSIIFKLLCCLAALDTLVNDTEIMNIKLNCCTDSLRKYLLY